MFDCGLNKNEKLVPMSAVVSFVIEDGTKWWLPEVDLLSSE